MASILPKPLEQTGGRFKFTLEQFTELSELGAFGDYRVELLDGEIFVMAKQGSRHAARIRKLSKRLEQSLGNDYWISTQLLVILLAPPPDYVEPDIALLKSRADSYEDRNVTSEDAELIIEVSDTTLQRDQGEKLQAYARNHIPEVWVLDLNANLLYVYRDSNGEIYRQRQVLEQGASLEFAAVGLGWW